MNFLIINILLQLLDLVTTLIVLDEGGRELNPIYNKMAKSIGIILSVIVGKLVVISMLLILYRFFYNEFIFIVILVIYSLVVLNNFVQIIKGGSK